LAQKINNHQWFVAGLLKNGNMPAFGLAAATKLVPITKRTDTAKRRVQKVINSSQIS